MLSLVRTLILIACSKHTGHMQSVKKIKENLGHFRENNSETETPNNITIKYTIKDKP